MVETHVCKKEECANYLSCMATKPLTHFCRKFLRAKWTPHALADLKAIHGKGS